jgi:hypothetical protein
VTPTICSGDSIRLTSSLPTGNFWSNGATTQSILVNNSGSYYVINSQFGCSSTSNIINVVVNPRPIIPIVTSNGPTTFCETGSVVLQTNVSTGVTWLPGGFTTQSILVKATGNYAVSVTNQFGCTTTSAPMSINVIASSTPPQATSNSPIMAFGSLQLYASNINNATYSWTGPNGFNSQLQNPVINNIPANMSGVYSVSAIISGCQTPFSSTIVNVINNKKVKIGGYFLTPNGDSIPSVKATLSGSSNNDTVSTIKGKYDVYGFEGGQYILTPSKNNDKIKSNGVSTLDIIKIQSHILNIDSLNSPYKIIAADVNSSGTVTNLDLLYIRRLILGIDTTFPNNKLWSFIDANFNFSNPNNPFPFKSTKSYFSFNSIDTQNFKGVKLGDVTYDWDKTLMRPYIYNPLEIYYDTINVNRNDTIHVYFKAKKYDKIIGFQFTLGWNASNMKFLKIGNNSNNIQFGLNKSESGSISVLWNDQENKELKLTSDEGLFEIVFIKKRDFDLENFQINSDITTKECYDNKLNSQDIILTSGVLNNKPNLNSSSPNILKVYPNPNNGILSIEFQYQIFREFDVSITNEIGQFLGSTHVINSMNQNVMILDLKKQFAVKKEGIYYLKIVNKNISKTFKIFIIN